MNQQNIPRKKMSWLVLLLSMTSILALAQSGQEPAYTHVFSISSESEGEVFLQDPCGSAVDHNGFVYISDRRQHKILKFDRDGALVMQWGVPGTAEGQFDQPGGVAVGSDGNLFVLDIGNYRVQKFTPEGDFILSFGSQGTQNGQFFDPLAITADHSGNIYVSDGGLGAKIQRFDLLGGFVDKFGTPFLIEGDLSTPKGLAFSADGTILVADSARSAVFEYNLAGTLINSVTLFETDAGSSSFVAPVGITVDRNGRIYVLDRLIGTNRIYYFNRDFLFQGIYFNNGSGSNQLDTPKSITTDTISNRVYVTDAGRGKLLRFTTNLNPVLEVGTNTLSGSRQLSTPGGVSLSGDLIYISDPDNKEIKTYFTTNFRYTGLSYRGPVSGPGALQSPGPLGVTSQGVLFVIDNQTDIKKFRRDGTFENANNASQNQRFNGIHVDPDGNHLITQITPLSNPMAGFREYGPDFSIRNASSTFDFLSPMGITRDKTGFVYVSDTSQNTVRAYNPMNGFGFSKSFEAPKVAPFFFSGPSSLAIDHRGNILIADSGNHRILKYDNNGKFIASFGSYGSMAGQFFHPIDIKADETGQIYVVERGNRRVQVFQTCQIIHTEERTICAGDSTLFEGIYYTTTGQFDRTFISQSGCDSTNRLELTVMDPIQTVMDTTICAGESINFFDSTLQITGTYQAILAAQNGCDSVVSLNLTVAEDYQIDAEVHICEGESLPFGDQILTQAGQYSNIFTSQQGCDSTVHLNLIISDTIFSQQTDTICIGDTLRIGDQFFTQPTSGRVTFPATAERCDSVVAFTLHVLDTFQTFRQDTICNGDNLRIGDAILNQSGTYEVVFPPTDKRCDSTVIVELTVLDRFISVRNDVICRGDTLEVDDFMFTESGTYNINFPATSSRCDSTITINLTVLENYYTLRRDTICQGESVRIDNQIYQSSGSYTINFPPNGLRCDSIVELRLTVLDTSQTYRSDTLCAGESLTINDQILTTTGEYVINFPPTQDRCDSVVTVNLTVLPSFQTERFDTICQGEVLVVGERSFIQTGTYDVIFSGNQQRCDSVVTVHLEVLPSFTDIRDVTICAGDTFTVGGQSLSQSGQITFPGETRAGCDSTLIYRVQVKPRYTTVLDTAICVGEQLKIGNTFFSSPGRFQYTFPENNVRCDSVIEILLAFKDTFRIHTETTICAGDTLRFGTQTIFDAGSYEERFPENDRRCDSLVFLDVTMLKPSFDTLNLELCPGDVLFFGSVRVDGPGTYDAQLLSANGCDSLLHIRVTPRAPQNTILEENVCEIDGYLFDGKIIRQSGTYQDTLRASNGCDSIITLQLTIEPTLVSKSEATICQGETYLFSGNRISEPGLYRDSFLAQTGCYFYLELDLTVLPNFSDTTFAEICSGQTYDFENQSYSRSGLFTKAYESIGGCDSIRYLKLTVNEPIIQSFEQQICNGDTFYYHELELTESGTYRDTLLNINGCDSIIEIQLDVFVPQHDTFNITLCGEEAYEFAGQFIDSAGIYTDTLSSNLGCDSIVTIDVTFIDSPKNLITVGGILMQANIENANYQWINCRDTTPILNAVSQFFIPSSNGEYAVLIEDENCTYLSECFQMIVGEDDSTITSAPFVPDISNQFRLYPNPVQSWISLEWTGEPGQNMEWQILDATGKVFAFTGMHILEKNSQISVAALPAGMYWIYLRSDTGAIARLRFIRME